MTAIWRVKNFTNFKINYLLKKKRKMDGKKRLDGLSYQTLKRTLNFSQEFSLLIKIPVLK